MVLSVGSGITIGSGISVTPGPTYGSYVFNGTSSWMNILGQLSDWNLGSTYTIEWWQNAPTSAPSSIFTVASQGDSSSAIDVFWNSGDLQLRNNSSNVSGEPPVNKWDHIAVVSNAGTLQVYYNGVQQSSSGTGGTLNNTASTLAIGRRGPANNFQYFSGKITGLRINTNAIYTSNFNYVTDSVLYPENIAGTVLLLKGIEKTPYVDSSLSAHTVTPSNMTWSSDYPTAIPVSNNLLLNLDAGDPASYPGSGSTWTDTISSIPFTLYNSPTYSSSNGGYLSFNPLNSQYAQGPSFPTALTNWTLEAWHYYDPTNVITPSSPCIITEAYSSYINFTLGNTTDSFPNIQTGFFNGGWVANPPGIILTPGNWYQLVGTWDGSTVKLYINGVVASSNTQAGVPLRSGVGIRLMRRWDATQYWGGNLGIVRIYDVDIGATGVLQNWNANKSRFGL